MVNEIACIGFCVWCYSSSAASSLFWKWVSWLVHNTKAVEKFIGNNCGWRNNNKTLYGTESWSRNLYIHPYKWKSHCPKKHTRRWTEQESHVCLRRFEAYFGISSRISIKCPIEIHSNVQTHCSLYAFDTIHCNLVVIP